VPSSRNKVHLRGDAPDRGYRVIDRGHPIPKRVARVAVHPVRLRDDELVNGTDQAIVREDVLGFKNSVTVVYEDGHWLRAPDADFAASLGQPLDALIASEKSAGRCVYTKDTRSSTASTSPPSVRTTNSSPAPYTPRPALTGDPASNIDYLLLTSDEVRSIVGGSSDLQVDGSLAAGPSDNSALVEPPVCVGVIFTAEQSVYGGNTFTAMRDETLRSTSDS
jgi:hypothetical protein